MLILDWRIWLVAVIATLYVTTANAEPVFSASVDGAKVVLHSEKCALAEITNLPFRAQWIEGNKVYEGCWTPPHPQVGVVVAYFADKTAIGVPAQMFRKVVGV